ncbi:hypothetical protein ACIRT4_16310 [Pseudomonas aeruginosa]|uniref:hypothetical protein n=1 Tax=Pseudomonas aeruginosa TaxID=287 RepID=UPI003D9B20FB
MNKANECTCPSGDGSLRWPCPAHPAVDQADVAAKLTFINGRPAMCGCQVEYSDGGGEYSDVIYVTLCAKHSGSAILDLVATNRIALTPEYEGQWHADLYLDREIPLAKVEGATPAEAVLALMSAERIDPEQESVEQAGGDERVAFEAYRDRRNALLESEGHNPGSKWHVTNAHYPTWEASRAALAQPSPKCATCNDSGQIVVSGPHYQGEFQPPEYETEPCDMCAQPSPAQAEQPTADDYEEVLADHRRLVREMDVLLNGEACAAKQAMLCDLVSQVEAEVRKSGQPLLVSAERYRWLRNDDNWGADDSEGQGTSKWANLGELSGTDFDAYLDQLRGSNPVMDIDPEHSKAIAKRGRDAIVAQAEGAPVIGCLCGMPMTEGRHSPGGCTSLEEFAPNPAQAQSEQAEAERPEMSPERAAYFMRRFKSEEKLLGPNEQAAVDYVLSLLAQHDRIVGALRADRDSWAEQAEQRLADWDEMRKERDAALARVEQQERTIAGMNEAHAKLAGLYEAAQAQHSVPELLEWAVGRWHAEVSLRPLINVHRRALDDTWRQVIRRLGGDTGLLCGPSHDELLAAAPAQGGE